MIIVASWWLIFEVVVAALATSMLTALILYRGIQ